MKSKTSMLASNIFDGTTHTCEVITDVLRFISDSFTIEQRLVKIQLLAKSLNGEEVAQELINVLLTTLGITSHHVIATMRNCAYMNSIAIHTLKILSQICWSLVVLPRD